MKKSTRSLVGKKVVDANYKMAITVTKEDIANGDRKQPNACAVALACRRQFDADAAIVNLTRTYIEYPRRVVRFFTTQALRNEIVAWDQGGKFTPGTYYLRPCPPTAKLEGYDRSKAKKRKEPPAPKHHPEGVRSKSLVAELWKNKENN